MKSNFTVVVLLIFGVFFIHPENGALAGGDPSWVHMKRAENLKESGEIALALTEARKARNKYIEEMLADFYEKAAIENPYLTKYELGKLRKQKELELKKNDIYPAYHEIAGDLYVMSDFLEEAIKEYKETLNQKKYFDYKDKEIEVKYKLADAYGKSGMPELEDSVYREICSGFFLQKKDEYWNRVRENIRKDLTLDHVFKVYRFEGIKYLKALYMVGRRCAVLQRNEESLFYLSSAAIVWMTYYSGMIKEQNDIFQYEGPSDFINYIKNNVHLEFMKDNYVIDFIMFYIGYNAHVSRDYAIMKYYFDLSRAFSVAGGRSDEIRDMVSFLSKNKNYLMNFSEMP